MGCISTPELVLVILLLLFTSALYYPSLFSGFIFDDWGGLEHARDFNWHDWMISFSPFSGAHLSMYWLLWAMIFKIAPTNPVPYHVAHLGLHLFSVAALWMLGCKLFHNQFAALAAAFLFAIHKVNANGVMWNSGATDTLVVAFAIPAFYCYLSYRETESAGRWLLLVSCVLYYLALKSKLMALTLPILLMSYELCCTSQPFRAKAASIIKYQWPYWAISAIYLWAFLAVGLPAEAAYKPVITVGHILDSINWYLSRILFDVDPSRQTALSILLGGSLLLAVVLRNRQMVFGWLWFLVTLGPVAPLASHRFETHLYLPIIGFCIYAAALLTWLVVRMRRVYSLFVVTAIGIGFLYVDLPMFKRISGFLLATWSWNQTTLSSLRGLLPSDPSGAHIYVYPRPEGALFDTGSSIRVLYRVKKDKLRVTVGEDKEMVARVIREPDAAKLLQSAYNDREYYDPNTDKLYVFDTLPRQSSLVTSHRFIEPAHRPHRPAIGSRVTPRNAPPQWTSICGSPSGVTSSLLTGFVARAGRSQLSFS